MTRRNLFALADSRARLLEARTQPTNARKQRSPLAREMRRLGWHTTPLTKAKAR
jgi:hypothetical protein